MSDTERWESSEKLQELRRTKKEKKIKRRKRFVILLLLIGAVIGALCTPVFNLQSVEVTGAVYVDELLVIDTAALTADTNIFKFNINKIAENIEKIPYVEDAEVIRKYPSTILINITEKTPAGYIQNKKEFIIIDKSGFCLEITEKKPESIPDLENIGVAAAEPGKKITVKNITLLEELLELLDSIYSNEIDFKITSVYKEGDDYYIKTSDIITIKLGSTEQINSKTAMLKEVLKKIPENTPGLIDATNSEKIYFQPIE